jgi:hypothetical protein
MLANIVFPKAEPQQVPFFYACNASNAQKWLLELKIYSLGYILKPFISKEIKAFLPHTPLKMPI